MQHSFFITMSRQEESLPSLLRAAIEGGCTITEVTARRSLDEELYFVRLAVEAEKSAENLRKEFTRMGSVKRVDVAGVESLAV